MLLSVSSSKVNLAERIVHVELIYNTKAILILIEVSNLMLQIMHKGELLQNSDEWVCFQVFIW